jgi:alanine dehydrogenase
MVSGPVSASDGAGGPVFVSAEAAAAIFRWEDAIAALQAVYARPFDAASVPSRTVASEGRAWLRSLPAMPPGCRHYGAKLMGLSGGAAVPAVEYVIVLFDRETSRIAAFVDAALVTAYRTAATSAAALDRLAPPGLASVAVLGSGLEASMHVRALAAVRPLGEVAVFSPTPERREAFARQAMDDLGVPARAVGNPRDAVAGADIVLAAARSHGEKPILFGDWLRPRATIASIGSTVPQQREIDVSVVERADFIVCDMLDEVLEETGDMIAAAEAGVDVRARSFSLGALMSGALEEQRASANLAMFKSVGSGLQDIVVAELILGKAREAGLVTPLPIAFESKRV